MRKMLYYFVINLFLLSFLGVLKSCYLYQINLYDNYSYDTMLDALGIHLTYYGVLVVFAIYLVLNNFFNTELKKQKIMSVLLLCFFYVFLLFLATRIIIVACILITVFMFLKYLKWKPLLVVTFLGLISFTLLYVNNSSYVITRFKNAFYVEADGNTDMSSREIHWKSVINSLKSKQAYVIGNGIGDKQKKLNQEYLSINFHGAESAYNAHNQFLEVLVATGFFGLFIFLLNFTFMIFCAIKTKNEALFILQIIFILTCITESMFERQLGIITYLTLNSLLLFSFVNSTKGKFIKG